MAILLSVLLGFGQTALAQELPQVQVGKAFTVENTAATLCPGNSDVVARIEAASGASEQIGLGVSTPEGLFSLQATLAPTWGLGEATVVVDCGMPESVLSYGVLVVPASESSYFDYAPYVGAGLVAVALVGWLLVRSNKDDGDVISDGVDLEDAGDDESGQNPASAMASAPSMDTDVFEDDSEYWFWDNVTDRGPVKRIACLSEQGFYLHEVPADGFPRLVDQLAQHGPEAALAAAFFAVPVDAIDEVHHRGTQLRVVHHNNHGEKVAQVIDLGTEVSGVVDLLSRRVPVVAAATPVPTR